MENIAGARVFITGGSGFIGSHVGELLTAEGAEVLILDRSKAGMSPDVARVVGDINDADFLSRSLNAFSPDFVIHLAGGVRKKPFEEAHDLFEANTKGTFTLLSVLKGRPLRRLVALGSLEECAGGIVPFSEDAADAPVNPYSLTKSLATRMIIYCSKQEDLPAVVLRPSVVYGPGQGAGALIPNSIHACLTKGVLEVRSGERTRDFLYVEDLCEGILKAMTAPGIDGQVIHLGEGREITLREVTEKICAVFGNSITPQYAPIPPGMKETMRYLPDISLARKVLGWKTTPLDYGLSKTIAWYTQAFGTDSYPIR